MSAKVLMGGAEYLRTSLDGEIVGRSVAELPHADVQGNLYQALRRYRRAINPRGYRSTNSAVFRVAEAFDLHA